MPCGWTDFFSACHERRDAELGARVVTTDSQQAGYEAANILDGDPDTMWHTHLRRAVATRSPTKW